MSKPLAVVTGASSGIGLELAAICAAEGFDLIVAADRPNIHEAAARFRTSGAETDVVETDLATLKGVEELWAAVGSRPVDALLANAGHGLGRAFLDQDFGEIRHVVDTNITGTIYLVQLVGRQMRNSRRGKILLTGSIAGFIPNGLLTAPAHLASFLIDTRLYVDNWRTRSPRKTSGRRCRIGAGVFVAGVNGRPRGRPQTTGDDPRCSTSFP